MKKGAMVVLLALTFTCASKEKINVVTGVPPVSGSLSSIGATLDAMSALPVAERGAYLERNWPHLDEDVVYFLRGIGKLQPGQRVRQVEFRFGSLDDVTAESGDGRNRHGYFENQSWLSCIRKEHGSRSWSSCSASMAPSPRRTSFGGSKP